MPSSVIVKTVLTLGSPWEGQGARKTTAHSVTTVTLPPALLCLVCTPTAAQCLPGHFVLDALASRGKVCSLDIGMVLFGCLFFVVVVVVAFTWAVLP